MELFDDKLYREGRLKFRGALKAHIIECGAKRTYSTDLIRWTGSQIDQALKWAVEFVNDLPEPGTYKVTDADATSDQPPYAVA